jgi:hypothetical protein
MSEATAAGEGSAALAQHRAERRMRKRESMVQVPSSLLCRSPPPEKKNLENFTENIMYGKKSTLTPASVTAVSRSLYAGHNLLPLLRLAVKKKK